MKFAKKCCGSCVHCFHVVQMSSTASNYIGCNYGFPEQLSETTLDGYCKRYEPRNPIEIEYIAL